MITVTIPLRTGRGMNGSHGHWSKAAKSRKSERNVAFWYLYDKLGGAHGPPRDGTGLRVVLVRAGPTNGLDDDNLCGSLKAVRDGVADWLKLNDNDPRMTWVYEQRRESTWSVSITVTQCGLAMSSSPEAPASSASALSAGS